MNWNNFKTIFFDLGNTLIHQQVDSETPLDQLNLELLPFAKEVVSYASQRCELGLITNTEITTEAEVWRCLEKLGISRFFNSVTTSVNVGIKKPNKVIFLNALTKHHAIPKNSIMIGNNYEEDIVPAKKIGMTTVLFGQEDISDEKWFSFADYFVKDGEMLLQLFYSWDR